MSETFPAVVQRPLRIEVDDEAARLEALEGCQVLDSAPDPELDVLVAHAARLAGTPIALVSLVDATRQWFKARVGLSAQETPRNISFCSKTILQREPFVVRDARIDPRFHDNPLVTGEPHVVFYAGWPLITGDGYALGSLCLIDHVPRDLSTDQCRTMALLARQVTLSLELRRAAAEGLATAPTPIADLLQRHQSLAQQQRSRTQLAQLVVHDLNNPLMVISANTAFVLEHARLREDERAALRDALASASRMQSMLADLLDISRATNGDGNLVARRRSIDLAELVKEVVGAPVRTDASMVIADLASDRIESSVDATLVGRMLRNLVENAKRYAPRGTLIVVGGRRVVGGVELTVTDRGRGISDADKERVFEKYAQLDPSNGRTSRGLGLLFCRLAARAHGGDIWVEDNTPTGARFRAMIPD